MKKTIIFLVLIFLCVNAQAYTVRVIRKPDSTIAVIHPAPSSKMPGETDQQWLDRIFEKAMDTEYQGMPYDDIDSSELPSREFRNAWEKDEGQPVKVNQTKKNKLKDKKVVNKEYGKVLRKQVIAELKTEGKIPPDYTEDEQ